jgi:hypothetical protein
MTGRALPSRLASENGAVLVFTAVAILVLVAFLTFVLDYGIMWTSRAQAQNSADAGALAGAIARALDDTSDPPPGGGLVEQAALQGATQNLVWNAAPAAQVSWNCPPDVVGACVRVDVYRNGEFGSTPLPMIFGPVLNITSQGVRATATARVATGNATECMRPFSVIDNWQEMGPALPDNPTGEFNRWKTQGSTVSEVSPADVYVPASSSGAGTGYTVAGHKGTQVVLKGGNPNSNAGAVNPGWYLPVRLPDGNGGYVSGASDFKTAIKQCIGQPVSIGQYLPLESGVMTGPTSQGVETDGDSLMNSDPNAQWDPGTQTITGSCAPACAPQSPRIVPISVFDMDEFQWRRAANNWTSPWTDGNGVTHAASPCPTGGRCIRVTNILGFFVQDMDNQGDVTGILMTLPGNFVTGAPSPGGGAAFLFTIQLVR